LEDPLLKKRPKTGSLELTVDQDRIFTELSERLYTSYLEAFRELIIQNTFDADAKKVEVTVKPDIIEIVDDGTGMDLEGIEEFLIIGSDAKVDSEQSTSGRPFIGGKGIGRLSWAQLGDKAVIYTQADGEAHFIEMSRGTRSVSVHEVSPLWDHSGTKWTITELHQRIRPNEVYKYLCDTGGLLTIFFDDFDVEVNGVSLQEQLPEGKSFDIEASTKDGREVKGVAVLTGKVDRMSVCVNYVKVVDRVFGGLGGFVNANFLRETSDRNSIVENDDYKTFTRVLKQHLKNRMVRFSENEQTLRSYLETFKHFARTYRTPTIGKRIPVEIIGVGEKKIGSLKGDIVFTNSHDDRAEMAVLNGYTVVLATDDYIPRLVKMIHPDAKAINDVDIGGRAESSASSERTRVLLSSAGRLVRESFKVIDPAKVYEATGISINVPDPRATRQSARESEKDEPEEGEEPKSDAPRPRRTRLATNTITARGIRISFVEYSNKGEPSFSSPSEIYLNTNNEFVGKVLDTPHSLMPLFLIDPVAHELAHIMLGTRIHDDDFVKLNDYLRYNLFLGHLSELGKSVKGE
jgi:hypothetical protein